MRSARLVTVTWLALVCVLAPAHAEKRVALVIGNGAYVHADRLANPVNDARGVRDALTALNFDVTYGEDLDGQTLRRKIGEFADHVTNADVALVYYAGHGATFGDTPYVVPVDAAFSSLGQVAYELVPVEMLIGELRQAKGVRIAILDACRDNGAERELKRQAQAARGGEITRGLAPMKNPGGLIIAYATQYLATAADDAGAGGGGLFSLGRSSAGHSPFTAALLHNIATPGLDVKDMFYQVGREVDAATGGKQRPEISISMYNQYALAPSVVASPVVSPPAGGQTPVPPPALSEAAQAWSIFQDTTSLAVLDAYIRLYGNDRVYGPLAKARREEVTKSQVAAAVPTPLRDAPLTPDRERGLKRGDTFRECADCPEMVVVPAGKFTMGSPGGEKGRFDYEGPQHAVTIGTPFAVGKLHVTRDQFAAFVAETKYNATSQCYKWAAGGALNGSWRDPGFAQEGSHPVVCVSWGDATAYADWVAKKTGKAYRLLSESEFEYATRGRTAPGTYPRFWFGDDDGDPCRSGNGADQKARSSMKKITWGFSCNDGFAYTSPAGHFQPNAFGLYDMAGDAWQWTADCWHENYNGAPADGSAWTAICGARGLRVVRGGSWYFTTDYLRAAARNRLTTTTDDNTGFRLARTLTP